MNINELKNIGQFIVKRKYLFTLMIFAIWMAFFDSNNYLRQNKIERDVKALQKDKAYYMAKIKTDSTRLNQLKTDKNNLERFAREQFMMKAPNEDVFVVVEEEDE